MKKVNNLKFLFQPKSIAVIGASRSPKKIGHLIFKNIIDNSFRGRVFPINPKAEKILNRPAYSSIVDIPQPVDLAIIVIPAPAVAPALEQAAEKGVKAAIIISAGFGESGPLGQKREEEIKKITQKYPIRVLGPNCLGIINPHHQLNASWGGSEFPKEKGGLVFFSQSGALSAPVLEFCQKNNLGLNCFISLGNKVDINETDILEFFEKEKRAKILAGYLESFKNGKEFVSLTRKITAQKPVIILKGGMSEEGAQTASSHTAALSTPQKITRGIFRQGGAIPAQNLTEFLNLLLFFSHLQEKRGGEKLAIITNAGGAGVLAVDALSNSFLKLASFSLPTVEKLKKILAPLITIKNPLDILGDADEARYQKALAICQNDPQVDSLLLILTKQSGTNPEKIARACTFQALKTKKPVIFSFLGQESVSLAQKIISQKKLVNFSSPEQAIDSLAAFSYYQEKIQNQKPKPLAKTKITQNAKEKVNNIIKNVLKEGRKQLNEAEGFKILEAYNINTPKFIVWDQNTPLQNVTKTIGFPLFIKIIKPIITHKTDQKAVIKVKNYQELKQALKQMSQRFSQPEFILEEAISEGEELILGVKYDHSFGHLLMAGAGGIYTEILKDNSFRALPLVENDAQEMLEELAIYPLLRGARGKEAVNLSKIKQSLFALSQLTTDFPQIKELDLNPLVCSSKSAVAVDIKILL